MKYKVIDLSIDDVNFVELDKGWFVEDGLAVYEFDNVYSFTNSLIYNLSVELEYGEDFDADTAYVSVIADLLANDVVDVNGFRYYVERE